MDKVNFGGMNFYRDTDGKWYLDPKGKKEVKRAMARKLDVKWEMVEVPIRRHGGRR